MIEVRIPRQEEISELEVLESRAREQANLVHSGVLYFIKLLGKHQVFAPTLRKYIHQLARLLAIKKDLQSKKMTPSLQRELKETEDKIQSVQSTLRDRTGIIDQHLGVLVEKMKLLQDKEKAVLEQMIIEAAEVSPEERATAINVKNKMLYILKKLFVFFQVLRQEYGEFHNELGTLLSQLLHQGTVNEKEKEVEIHKFITQGERSLKNVLEDAEKVALQDKILAHANHRLVLKVLERIHTAQLRVIRTYVGRAPFELK